MTELINKTFTFWHLPRLHVLSGENNYYVSVNSIQGEKMLNANGGWAQLQLSDSLKFNSAESVYLDS